MGRSGRVPEMGVAAWEGGLSCPPSVKSPAFALFFNRETGDWLAFSCRTGGLACRHVLTGRRTPLEGLRAERRTPATSAEDRRDASVLSGQCRGIVRTGTKVIFALWLHSRGDSMANPKCVESIRAQPSSPPSIPRFGWHRPPCRFHSGQGSLSDQPRV